MPVTPKRTPFAAPMSPRPPRIETDRRWVRRRCAAALVVLACLGFPSCGGGASAGGGRRPNHATDAVPYLAGAALLGTSATPSPGDRLQLFFSEDLTLVPGRAVDDLDLSLSAGTLGNVVAAARFENPRTIEVFLGAGVEFVPGTTTIDVAATNDAIRDRTGNLAVASTPRVITLGDADAPDIPSVTLNGVGDLLNGEGPAGGMLQVPSDGFTIDIEHSDGSSAVDPDRTVIVASVVVSVDGTNRQAGIDLAGAMTRTATGSSSSFFVEESVALPAGTFELTVYVFDATGRVSAPARFTALSRPATDALRPFETTANPTQLWFIDTGRDVESYSLNVLDFVTPARVHAGANGRSDLEDVLFLVGMLSASPIPNVHSGKDSNEVVLDAFRAEVLKQLDALFQGANVKFTFTRPGAWPGGSSVPYGSFGFSQIALTGAATAAGDSGIHGTAIFDPNNRFQDDDTQLTFQGSERLGVFLHTVINDGLVAHPTTLFRTTFDPFTTARFGTPIGEESDDGLRLAGYLNDARTTHIANAVLRSARFAAVILAHECGHSVGLVANGPMPRGLYGNDPMDFPVYPAAAADGHIQMPASLFPGVSTNIMSPGFDFVSALASETRFNSLNRAYLREGVVVDGNQTP